ncbi:MAG: signal peptidase II [Nitrospiraceae bacterium]|nr:signal peptidase II [Nitrospiraceae bacterium]
MITWIISALLITLDQITKYLAHRDITPAAPDRITSFLNLVNVKNTGAAFGIMQTMGNAFFIAISAAAIIFIIVLLIRDRRKPAGLVLILSGALGNLIDRLSYGYVRDFIDFHAGSHHWPAFNFADAYLSVGILLLFLGSFTRKK